MAINKQLIKLILCIQLQAVFCQTKLDKFYEDLNLYKPNAPWIMGKLLKMDVSDFFEGFKKAFHLLADARTRADYFGQPKEQFNSEDFWSKSWWQCTVYEIFLKKTFVDLQTSKLILAHDPEQESYLKTKGISLGIFHIFDFFGQARSHLEESEHHMLFVFYAFYIDCIMHVFSTSVQNAYLAIEQKTDYKHFFNLAKYCQKQTAQKVKELSKWQKSDIDKIKYKHVYAGLVEKNKEIIDALQFERLDLCIN